MERRPEEEATLRGPAERVDVARDAEDRLAPSGAPGERAVHPERFGPPERAMPRPAAYPPHPYPQHPYPPAELVPRGGIGTAIRRYGVVGLVLLAVPVLLAWLLLTGGGGTSTDLTDEEWAELLAKDPRATVASAAASGATSGASGAAATGGSGLSVSTFPVGAVVSLDLDTVGVTPLDGHALAAGTYLLTVSKEGYYSHHELLTVAPGEAPALYYVLDELGDLTGDLASAGGAVWDAPRGDRPAEPAPSTRADREAADEPVRPAADRESAPRTPAAAPADPTSGQLAVLVRPWGSIYIDGRLHKAETDATYRVTLPEGSYEVEARHPALGRVLQRVTVEAGGAQQRIVLDVGRDGTALSPAASPGEVPVLPPDEAAEPAPGAQTPYVHTYADEPPVLIGGLESLHRAARYPRAARRAGVEGRVYLQFVVGVDGRVRAPRVVRGLGAGLDEEALRVVREARFEPGRVDGEPVSVQHALFLTFQLSSQNPAP